MSRERQVVLIAVLLCLAVWRGWAAGRRYERMIYPHQAATCRPEK